MTANRPAAEGYAEADVLVVADTLDEDISCEVWCAGCDSHRAARRVLAALAEAGRLLPEVIEVRTEFGVRWHAGDSDGIRLDLDRIASPEQANEVGQQRIGEYGITRYTVERREHRLFADGSSWTGPWAPVEHEPREAS